MQSRPAAHARLLYATALTLLLLGAAAGTAHGATYYVAPTGIDANPGTQAAPWLTLQKAGDVAGAGDTVNVSPGTYTGFRPRQSGTATAPVRFLAQPGVVIASPSSANSNGDNIWVRNVDYIVIDGFESTNAPRAGIAVQGEPDANTISIVIRNCHCHHNNRWGIFTAFARELVLENNETSYSAVEHGVYVSNSGDRPTVRGNHAHHNNASGIQLNADPEQMGDDPNDPEGDGIITGALIERNVIHDNGTVGGAAINLASVRTSLIRNNLLYGNRSTGIAGWDDGFDPQYGTRDNRIVGNTILQAANSRYAIGLKNGSINNGVFGNILLNAGPRGSLDVDPDSQVGLQSDYNIVVDEFSDDDNFLNIAQWRALGFDVHSIIATPSQVFVSGTDYHLAATSPARDAGIPLIDLPTDIEDVVRPQGAAFDIGAYERAAGPMSPTPTSSPPPAPTATRTATASPTRTASPTATMTLAGANRIAGVLRYYRGNHPVPGVTVHLSGPAPRTAASDAAGGFELTAVPDGAWQLEPRKLGGGGPAISALDAAYVLQYAAGARPLDAMQRLACDVTANGAPTALDATRILEFAVGLRTEFPATTACASSWLFAPQPTNGGTLTQPTLSNGLCQPGTIGYPQLAGDVVGQDFRALLIGDCTGNWQPTATAAAVRQRGVAAARLTRLRPSARGRLRAALILRPTGPVQAVEVTLAIDPDKLQLAGARPALAGRDALLLSYEPTPGNVAIALANNGPLAVGQRTAIIVEFESLARDAARSRITVERLAFDE